MELKESSGWLSSICRVVILAWNSRQYSEKSPRLPDYLTTVLPDYLTTLLPDYLTTLLPDYLTTLLPDYLTTLLPDYLTTLLPDYLTTVLPDYLTTLLPDYLTTLLPDYLSTSSPDDINSPLFNYLNATSSSQSLHPKSIKTAMVDCNHNEYICKEANIPSYPTLKLYIHDPNKWRSEVNGQLITIINI